MARHCMHEDGRSGRYCCWCDLEQQLVEDRDTEPLHGARFGGQRYQTHWAPSSTRDDCPHEIITTGSREHG